MIATGTRCALPFAASSIRPRARGPVSAGLRLAICAKATDRSMAPTLASAVTFPSHSIWCRSPILRYKRKRNRKDTMEINDKAPEFTSLDQDGSKIALKDFKGKWVVLYFYPRADTPGCTIEACSFRDSFKRVEKIGAVVLGVSPDTAKDQKKFVDKFDLPFTLVADADKTICNAYGVIQEKNMY